MNADQEPVEELNSIPSTLLTSRFYTTTRGIHAKRPFSSLTASNTNGEHCPDGERLSQPSSIRLDEPSSSSTTELVAGNRVDGSCVNLQLAYQRGAGTYYDSASGRISSDNSERYEIGPGCFQSPPLVSNPTALSTTDRQLEGVSLLSTATTWAGSLDPTAYHNAVNNGEFHEHAATIPSGRPISDPTSASGRIDRNRGRRAQLSTGGSPSRTDLLIVLGANKRGDFVTRRVKTLRSLPPSTSVNIPTSMVFSVNR
ncbi:hypothetical protein FXO37_06151 [Capsicum annuum]|nr:hypothetical protein FXO37_06151 [Capsicum annuum]